MNELKELLEEALHEWQRDQQTTVDSWSAIENEPATYGVELEDGYMYFISIVEA